MAARTGATARKTTGEAVTMAMTMPKESAAMLDASPSTSSEYCF